MHKLEFAKKYIEHHQKANEWLDSVPYEVRSTFFDTPFINSFLQLNDMMSEEIFSFELLEDINWFLFGRGGDPRLERDDNTYIIDTVDDFMNYLYECYDDEGNPW